MTEQRAFASDTALTDFVQRENIRVWGDPEDFDGPGYAVLIDVCRCLGNNPTLTASRVRENAERLGWDPDEALRKVPIPTVSGPQTMWVVDTHSLVHILLTSRSPKAQFFRDWVQVFLAEQADQAFDNHLRDLGYLIDWANNA
jgi:prophage antirepressor-like protein